MSNLLSIATFLPLLGVLLILFMAPAGKAGDMLARQISLFATAVTFAVTLVLWWLFDPSTPGFQFEETYPWLGGNINYHLGVDGISLPFVILTAFLMPLCILASWTSIETRVKEYMIAFLVLETLMIGVFVSLDLVLFYLFFEGGLIPMFLIIGIWGGTRRVYASFKFFLYTLLGSVLMLIAVMAMYVTAGTTDIPTLMAYDFPPEMQTWLWLAFFASFAVKMPMWPVHTWLPDAHVEAPTAGSVILAGILLKMGGYGFLRFSLPMFPDASVDFAPLVFALSVIAIIYTSLVALMQEDIKKLIAYSSVDDGPVRAEPPGHRWRRLSDDQPRLRLGRALPLRRRRLRPHAHARDQGLWRSREPHAALRRHLHGLHDGQCGPAGNQRLCRRVPDPRRRVQGQHDGCASRDHRRGPQRRLCTLALQTGGVR
jgi:NADH-quinone oxidoreductase subunit M